MYRNNSRSARFGVAYPLDFPLEKLFGQASVDLDTLSQEPYKPSHDLSFSNFPFVDELLGHPNDAQLEYRMNQPVYVVAFKRASSEFMVGYGAQVYQAINPGDAVVVACEKGENVGIVTQVHTLRSYMLAKYHTTTIDPADVSRFMGRIIRNAALKDYIVLQQKGQDELRVVQFCRDIAPQYGLHIRIVDAEYQFDRTKLTIYYESHCRVDFRDYVKTLYTTLRVKVWMEKV